MIRKFWRIKESPSGACYTGGYVYTTTAEEAAVIAFPDAVEDDEGVRVYISDENGNVRSELSQLFEF